MVNTNTYKLSGMHCGSCVDKITKALTPLADRVEVSLNSQQVVLANAKVDVRELQAAVASAGQYLLTPLVPSAAPSAATLEAFGTDAPKTWLATYQPLLLLISYVTAASVLIQIGSGQKLSVHETMRYFMAGFFGTFSFFKLINLREFSSAYGRYDILAGAWPAWGLIYPFVELALGISYLGNFLPAATNAATLAVMSFSAIGVIRAVTKKANIQCACLGAVLKLPMSTVTIVEDLGMAAMAGLALFAGV